MIGRRSETTIHNLDSLSFSRARSHLPIQCSHLPNKCAYDDHAVHCAFSDANELCRISSVPVMPNKTKQVPLLVTGLTL